MAEFAAFFAGYEAGEEDGRAVQSTQLAEVRYQLVWLAGARPLAHPEPMKGRASFDSVEDAQAFLKRQASVAKALSLTRLEVSTTRIDLCKLLAVACLDQPKAEP
ncbi:hypothetical protein [Paracoccus sulfuroxidans]|uniref:Uncharacterized protein n=1 Tax=Paracoccus sulfuroxidans TaxID=384678 RepID=A0A562NQ00_9RHOB|nr:hypothetical protein [Paracoccus sulfuroxidans]TWI34289.1 hypothetical protein IQ24_01804 [Paracoccus sulfuroxidans]